MAINRTPTTPGGASPGGMPAILQMKGMKGKKPKKLKKPSKPLPRFMLVVLTAFFFILLIGGVGACLYFDVNGIAGKAAVILLPKYRTAEAGLAKREAEIKMFESNLKTDWNKLKADQAKIIADRDSLTQKTADLASREKKLAADKQAFEASKRPTISSAPTSSAGKGSSAVDIYKNLDASDAAAMLVKAPTLREAADILSQLPTANAAEIIAAIKAIDAEKAYNLTKLIGQ